MSQRVVAVGDQGGAFEAPAGPEPHLSGDLVSDEADKADHSSASKWSGASGSMSFSTANAAATQALTKMANTTARPERRSADCQRRKKAPLAAALAPALGLTRLEPSEAIRGERITGFTLPRWAMRITLLGGLSGAYSARTLVRRPVLTAATIVSIAAAVGLAAALNVVVTVA